MIVASRRNRRCRTRGTSAIVAILIFLLVFGVFFFIFFNRMSGGFTIIPIWITISGLGSFIIIVAVIGVIAASMSKTYKKPREENLKSYQYHPQRQTQQPNPYIIRDSIPKQLEEPINKEIGREIPVITDIKYCKYCGSKIDKDAVFCHMCGIKL